MSRYEREYGPWDDLDRDEATERAYAIGVAEKLGEYNREELEAIYEAMETSYDRSMVELAYREGRREATAVAEEVDDGAAVWADLVEGETTVIDPGDAPTGGRDGLPEALDPTDLLDRQNVDSTEALDLPDFLKK
ncbi:hypothetical protein [Halomicrobium salinisoli]|uniref:hypothetical protein n=1 Tax=Halomicrobium salinisoli TaxID=2878391 RepID=UPI001CF071AD|nr:hypothetical protein [Halomicrobium salinisoli]